uniref:Uncharacterized protein n=1 Tax=Setaria italica TaxID=4555 RepID=K4A4E7_SETIT
MSTGGSPASAPDGALCRETQDLDILVYRQHPLQASGNK